VAGFFTSPRDVYPAVVAADMNWAAPFCCNYLIAAAVRADEAPAASRQAVEAAGLAQAERVVAAMRTSKPGVIVIDAGRSKLGFADRRFDYLQCLMRAPALPASCGATTRSTRSARSACLYESDHLMAGPCAGHAWRPARGRLRAPATEGPASLPGFRSFNASKGERFMPPRHRPTQCAAANVSPGAKRTWCQQDAGVCF
jgi:hypothetical protein